METGPPRPVSRFEVNGMAKKPKSELSEAYRRRIERAEAKGLSRQAARGHKAGEHITRKEHRLKPQQTASGQLTGTQKGQLTRYAKEQARRIPIEINNDPNGEFIEFRDALIAWTTLNGYGAFIAVREGRRALVAQYANGKSKRFRDPSIIGTIQLQSGVPSSDPRWFYYH